MEIYWNLELYWNMEIIGTKFEGQQLTKQAKTNRHKENICSWKFIGTWNFIGTWK